VSWEDELARLEPQHIVMLSEAEIKTPLDDSVAIYRKARKQWACQCPGGGQRCPHTRSDGPMCLQTIQPGDEYVEYLGEAAFAQSGSRYCLPCGVDTWQAP